MTEQTGGMVSKAAVVEKLRAINAGRLKEVPKDISPTSANIVLYKTDAVVDAIKAIEAMPCSDDDPRRMTPCHIAAITKARDVFANYAKLHKAKRTKEAEQKAAVNYALSLEMDEALSDNTPQPDNELVEALAEFGGPPVNKTLITLNKEK